jgi:hypothetical protein
VKTDGDEVIGVVEYWNTASLLYEIEGTEMCGGGIGGRSREILFPENHIYLMAVHDT